MIDVPYREVETIVDLAQRFLDEHGVDSIPVDIEWIIESKYRIDIIPTPGLRREVGKDAFITCDGMSIYVDDDLQTRYGTRYRFTLAHEMAHRYIHGDELAQCNFRNITEWKHFMERISVKAQKRMEFQAHTFAGLILVPTQYLSQSFDAILATAETSIRNAKQNGAKRAAYLPRVHNYVAVRLATQFDVSREVMMRRIDAEKLMARVR